MTRKKAKNDATDEKPLAPFLMVYAPALFSRDVTDSERLTYFAVAFAAGARGWTTYSQASIAGMRGLRGRNRVGAHLKKLESLDWIRREKRANNQTDIIWVTPATEVWTEAEIRAGHQLLKLLAAQGRERLGEDPTVGVAMKFAKDPGRASASDLFTPEGNAKSGVFEAIREHSVRWRRMRPGTLYDPATPVEKWSGAAAVGYLRERVAQRWPGLLGHLGEVVVGAVVAVQKSIHVLEDLGFERGHMKRLVDFLVDEWDADDHRTLARRLRFGGYLPHWSILGNPAPFQALLKAEAGETPGRPPPRRDSMSDS